MVNGRQEGRDLSMHGSWRRQAEGVGDSKGRFIKNLRKLEVQGPSLLDPE